MSGLLTVWPSDCGKLPSIAERKLADFVQPALKFLINSVKKVGTNNAAIVSGLDLWLEMTEANMKTREIPRDEWKEFFDNFSRKHEGRGVTLEIFGPDIGDQVEERGLFLAGVTAEVADKGAKIEIMIGGKPDGHVTHIITEPTQVDLEKSEEGTSAALQIKSADGLTALLHLL